MKKVAFAILFSFFLCEVPRAYAQENISAGGLLSTAYYMGDFNNDGAMYMPGVYVGGMINRSLSEYYGLRVNVGGGELRGDPSKYKGSLMPNEAGQVPSSFKRFFFDMDFRFEVGFLPYDPFGTDRKTRAFSPYFALGAGVGYSNGAPFVQLPLAVGMKYRIAYRFTLGVEWAFRKTFNDKLDGWENIRTTSGGTVNNNDWISYAGIYLTYQLSDRILCPALK